MLELIPGTRPVSHILCEPTGRSRYVVHLSARSSKRIEPHKTAAEVTPTNVWELDDSKYLYISAFTCKSDSSKPGWPFIVNSPKLPGTICLEIWYSDFNCNILSYTNNLRLKTAPFSTFNLILDLKNEHRCHYNKTMWLCQSLWAATVSYTHVVCPLGPQSDVCPLSSPGRSVNRIHSQFQMGSNTLWIEVGSHCCSCACFFF